MLSFRETLRRYVVVWLSDRGSTTKSSGFKFLYAMASLADAGAQFAVEGIQAAYPGMGTPTALPYIGRDRRIIRGPLETNEEYAARLINWLQFWSAAGSAKSVMEALQAYLSPGHPRIRIVTRGGYWSTLETDGSLTDLQADPNNWDYDSISNPELVENWADFWIFIYQQHYPNAGQWDDGLQTWTTGSIFGHDTSTNNAIGIADIVNQYKSAFSRCVNMIFTYDDTSFDPASAPGAIGMPDGLWGKWSKDVAGVRVRSRRADCRYWEV